MIDINIGQVSVSFESRLQAIFSNLFAASNFKMLKLLRHAAYFANRCISDVFEETHLHCDKVLQSWLCSIAFDHKFTIAQVHEEFIGNPMATTQVQTFEFEALGQCLSKFSLLQTLLVHKCTLINLKGFFGGCNRVLKADTSNIRHTIEA